jgi:hypothetical protein
MSLFHLVTFFGRKPDKGGKAPHFSQERNGVLELEDHFTDYTLPLGETCWITCGNVDIWIKNYGVVEVEAFNRRDNQDLAGEPIRKFEVYQ